MTTMERIALLERQMRELALMTFSGASCDWGNCVSEATGYRWTDEHGWLPVCPRHSQGDHDEMCGCDGMTCECATAKACACMAEGYDRHSAAACDTITRAAQ